MKKKQRHCSTGYHPLLVRNPLQTALACTGYDAGGWALNTIPHGGAKSGRHDGAQGRCCQFIPGVLNPGQLCSPGNICSIWRHGQSSGWEGVLMASGEWRSRMLLNIQQWADQPPTPQHRITWPPVFTGLGLRKPGTICESGCQSNGCSHGWAVRTHSRGRGCPPQAFTQSEWWAHGQVCASQQRTQILEW